MISLIAEWKYYSMVSSHTCRFMTCMYIQTSFYNKKGSKHLLKHLHKSSRHAEYEKKMWSKSEHALNAIWALNGFFTDEWSEIRTPSTLPLPCLEHVDTSTSRSRCIINEAGLTWIPVREKNVCVRVVPYISTLCVNVVQSRPSRATIVILTSQVVWK